MQSQLQQNSDFHTPLPVSTRATCSGAVDNDVAKSPVPGTPDFVEVPRESCRQQCPGMDLSHCGLSCAPYYGIGFNPGETQRASTCSLVSFRVYSDRVCLFADSALTPLNASVDMCQHQHEACDQVMYSVKDGRILSPATRALLSMLQGSRIPGGGMRLWHQQLEISRKPASPYVGVVFSMKDKR